MDSLYPFEVRKLSHAVLTALATPDPTDDRVLGALATDAGKAGPIDRIVLLIREQDTLRRFGPYLADGSSANLVHGSESIAMASLPARPTCFASPSNETALTRTLRACGLDCFTIVPLLNGGEVLGAWVLGHPAGQAPTDAVKAAIDPLFTIGTHMGTAFAMRRLAESVTVAEGGETRVSPSSFPLGTSALRSIAMTGRLASLGTLAGGLVHDVNNPATFIALAGGQIEKFVAKAQKGGCEGLEPVVDLANGIRESTEQIRDMVAAFRLLVGVANRSVVVTVDLERVLKAAVQLTRAAHRHDAVLETNLQQMPSCPGHYVELGPVVVNVLVNAIESLRSSNSPNMVRVEGRIQNDVIQIRVRDTGEGIVEDVIPHVFDPFFTTRDRSRHAGLGLTIAREAVLSLDGQIDIESIAGKGTTVRINVPVKQPG